MFNQRYLCDRKFQTTEIEDDHFTPRILNTQPLNTLATMSTGRGREGGRNVRAKLEDRRKG